MKKRFWAFALMVVMLISIFPVSVLAEAPGTEQKLTTEDLGGESLVYHSRENDVELTLYCFNSELNWPHVVDPGLNELYVPDERLHLSEEVKDLIYRILYAGYPHNNLNLYSGKVEDIKIDELKEAVNPPDELKAILNGYDWGSLNFETNRLVGTQTNESEVINDLWWKLNGLNPAEQVIEATLTKPDFYSFICAWNPYGLFANENALLQAYAERKSTPNLAVFHDATQIAIWRILYENKVPNNKRSMEEQLVKFPLAKQLVDFANGVGEHKYAKIPPRDSTSKVMKAYKEKFESGLTFLRSDGTPVGADGTIVFTKEGSEYVSEPLHFDKDTTYVLPYIITLKNGEESLIAPIVNYGNGEFRLHSSTKPSDANGRVTVEADDQFPSELYQYVVEWQKDIPAEELSKDNHNSQDMTGVYYESVPMTLSFKTLSRDEQEFESLIVKKTVEGYPELGDEKEFKFTVELSNKNITGLYGSMNFVEGVAKFALKDKQYKHAENLPVGITYKVTEDDYSGDGFTTEKIGDTGTITKDQTATASFTNTYKAKSVDVALKGNKTMNGKNLSEGEFSFTITDDRDNNTKTVKNAADGTIDFGTYNFDAAGIYTFVVKEVNDGRDGINYDNTVYNITVTVTDDGSGELKAAITGCAPTGDNINFTNGIGGGDDHDDGGGSGETSITRNGSLTISKNVTGDLGDKNKLFTFHVAFNTDNYYAYTGSKTGVIKNGGTVQLKDGESITINGIPSGVAYAIVESDNAGYRVYKTGDAGIIVADQTLKASFTNTKSSVPQTGDNRHLFIWMSIMAISFIGCIISLVFTIRKRNSHE